MSAIKHLLSRLLFWLCWACAVGGLSGAGSAWAEELAVVPPFSGPLVDQAGLLKPEQADELDRRLRQFAQTHGSQIAVLIVPTTRPESIEQYSHRVFDDWKVGRKKINDGVLILVAVKDRKLRIDTGYGLEGAIPDAVAKRIIAETMAPKFREGAAFEGVRDAVGQIERLIEGEQLPAPQGSAQSSGSGSGSGASGDGWIEYLIPGLFAIIVFGGVLRLMFGRFFGSLTAGGLAGVIVWFLASSLMIAAIAAFIAFLFVLVSNGRGSSWGSGGSWGDGGGWSGGDSWSGGGGDSGGGGASGDW